MEQARGVADLIGRIYDATAEPSLWPDVIAEIAHTAGCRSGIFYEHDTATHKSRPLGFFRLNPEMMRDYEAYYGARDPWNTRVMSWPVGVLAPTYMLMPDEEFRRTEFYQDHLRLNGVFYGLGGVVERAEGRMAVFGVQCSYEDGRFSREAMDVVTALMPHLKRAYRIHNALAHTHRDRDTLEEVLRLVTQPVLIVDREARLFFANAAAERILVAGDGIRLNAGCIAASHRDDQTLLMALLDPAPEKAGNNAALRRPRDKRLLVQAVPLRIGGRWDPSARVALLLRTDAATPLPVEQLASAFDLTKAEARLWSGLAAGATLAEIAARQRTSINTLRVQLGRLFAKVGVHRQADLVRRALELGRPDGGPC
jgi:DNA-binding CsgD family transcriptional regulator